MSVPERWEHSKAKAVLKQLFESDESMMKKDEEELYHLSPDLFGQYRFDRFKENSKNLKKKITEDREMNAFQEAALVHDRQMFPKNSNTHWGYGRWDQAEAKTQLRADVKNNLHKSMKPKDLRQSKIEVYGQFPLDVFRNHIYQELSFEGFSDP